MPRILAGIHVSRDLRLEAGALLAPSSLSLAGVNLLRHAALTALKVCAAPDIALLTTEPDEGLLALCGELGLREAPPLQWMAKLYELAGAAGPGDAVLVLHQTAPLRDHRPLERALVLLARHRCVFSAKAGVGPDEAHTRALEAWRLSEFTKFGFGGPAGGEGTIELAADEFVEINQQRDEAAAARVIAAWPRA